MKGKDAEPKVSKGAKTGWCLLQEILHFTQKLIQVDCKWCANINCSFISSFPAMTTHLR